MAMLQREYRPQIVQQPGAEAEQHGYNKPESMPRRTAPFGEFRRSNYGLYVIFGFRHMTPRQGYIN
jgi:hypothetical protein